MKIAMNAARWLGFSLEEVLVACKEAGFDAVDIPIQNILGLPEWNEENYVESAKKIRALCRELDLPVEQTHAGGKTFEDTCRAIRIAALLGAPSIVVHPKIARPYKGQEEKYFEMNMEYYGRFVPLLRELGIKIAVENMFGWDLERWVICHNIVSKTEEFLRYMDTLEERWPGCFTACVDIGHMALVGTDLTEVITALGKKNYLSALHVHDNDLHMDMHAAMNIGAINFTAISKALKEIDYQGAYAMEIGIHGTIPKTLLPATLRYIARLARYYADLASN